MIVIGEIDIEKYKCVTDRITTGKVVITEERISHIHARHSKDWEVIQPYLRDALSDPDYILEDRRHPDTGLILKWIEENGIRFQMVLRLHTANDPEAFQNSILSAWRISEIRWNNYLKNKKILYKKESACYNKSRIEKVT